MHTWEGGREDKGDLSVCGSDYIQYRQLINYVALLVGYTILRIFSHKATRKLSFIKW